MHDNIRKQWVDKLRSGEYPQGRQVLRTREGEFCCLGVLCELAVEQKVIPEPTLSYGGAYFYHDDKVDDAFDSWLPPSVRKWAGLQTDEVKLTKPQRTPQDSLLVTTLTGMNDKGCTFAQIADFIESDDFEEAVDKSK
jgi:hypothetical protein